MFKVSGIWVSPFEVESALITHPAVLEAAVVPEADPEGLVEAEGVRGAARRTRNTDGLHEALKEHVKQKIGPWKYPRWIDVVDSLPKTATGKIQRFKLRDGGSQSDVVSTSSRRTPGPIATVRRCSGGAANLLLREAAAYGSRRSPGRRAEDAHLDHFGKPDMTTLSPSGFLTIGASDLEYRMIGPRPSTRRPS